MTNITLKVLGKNITKETLNTALSKKNCIAEEIDGELCLRIESEKAGNIDQDSANNKRLTVREAEAFFEEKDIKVKKRRYTKREDWNDPDLPKDHDVNRPDERFNARVDKETNALAKEYLKATKMTKKELTIKAIRTYIENNPPEI